MPTCGFFEVELVEHELAFVGEFLVVDLENSVLRFDEEDFLVFNTALFCFTDLRE